MLSSLLAALLPERERGRLCARTAADAVRGSFVAGGLQVFVAGPFWAWQGVEYMRQVSDAIVGAAPGAVHAARFALVGMGPVSYLISPLGLILEYTILTGVLRLVSAGVQGRPVGDPALTFVLWAGRALHARGRRRQALGVLGPERPDRMERRGADRVVFSSREKAGWDERVTVRIGDALYRISETTLRPDRGFKAVAYTLSPWPAEVIVRRVVDYGFSGAPDRVASPVAETRAPAEKPAGGDPHPGRSRFHVDAGEEARLAPEAGTDALIESCGFLPIRLRVEQTPTRPAHPGTAIEIGGEWYEALSETVDPERVEYRLRCWPAGEVLRDTVRYGPALVRAAQQERALAAGRRRGRRGAWPAYPLIGMLPETRQRLLCDRLGLDPRFATASAALAEMALVVWTAASGVSGAPGEDPAGVGLYAALATSIMLGPQLGLALLRGLAAVAVDAVAGQPFVVAVFRLGQLIRLVAERFDKGVVPLTRDAFWARLELPDRQRPGPDGSVDVETALPHLSWSRSPRLAEGGQAWRIEALAPILVRGRLTWRYRLHPVDEGAAGRSPSPTLYRDDVWRRVAREWGDLLSSGFGPVVSLLPAPAQRRAMRQQGPAGIRSSTILSIVAEILVGILWGTAREMPLIVAGMALCLDALLRLVQVSRGDFAPSLLGRLLDGYLRPERLPFQEHLDAERAALGELSVVSRH
jgi:hypothetical protein